MGEKGRASAWAGKCEIIGREGSICSTPRARLALYVSGRVGWGVGRSRVGVLDRLVLHALFERAEALADPLAQFRQLLRPENQQGDSKDQQKVCWLKKSFHRNLPRNALSKRYLSQGGESTEPLGRSVSFSSI